MSEGPVFKQPNGKVLKGWDWTTPANERSPVPTITASAWSSDPAGLTLADNGIDGLKTSVLISDGTDGEDYWVENKVTLSNGEEHVLGFWVYVRDKL